VRPIQLLPTFSLFVVVSLVACKKTPGIVKPSDSTTTTSSSDTLSQNVYSIDSTTSPPQGIILTAPFNFSLPTSDVVPGMLLVMDQSGKVLMKKTTTGNAFDFERWVINGKTRYTYLVNDPTVFRPTGDVQNAGYAIIADSNLNTLQQINFIPYAPAIFPSNQGLDVHDFVLISDSDYITLTYYWKFPTNIPVRLNPAPNVSVLTPVIEEVRDGAVVFHWDASDDTSFYANSIFDNDFSDTTTPQDYVHMNSMFVDPTDGNLICSMRDQDQVIKINRQTGVVIWRLGGLNSDFPLTADQKFLYQHDATLTDSNQTLMLFDNGDVSLRPYTRICEFHLNYANKTVTSFRYFNIPEPFTQLTGSVQKFGDEYFIGGGTAQYMLEVNPNTGQKIIEFQGNLASYRSFKYLTQGL